MVVSAGDLAGCLGGSWRLPGLLPLSREKRRPLSSRSLGEGSSLGWGPVQCQMV